MTKKQDDAAADLLIQEVDEELRHDQMQTLWKRYGSVAIAGAVAIVLAVAGSQGWNAWQADQRQQASARYSEALKLAEQGQKGQAADVLTDLAAEGAAGYRLLARLEQADLLLQSGDTAGAVSLYQSIAADGGVDDVYRDMARLKAAYLQVDSADAAAVAAQVEPLANDASPWRHSAREILGLSALKQGDRAKATDIFRKLSEDTAAPQGIRARAAEMMAAAGLGSKG